MMGVGAPCPFFEPRHSRWHRMRMLHALGEIDLAAPAEALSMPRMRDVNWLVIHAGSVDRAIGPGGATHIDDSMLEQWCILAPGESPPGAVPQAPLGAATAEPSASDAPAPEPAAA